MKTSLFLLCLAFALVAFDSQAKPPHEKGGKPDHKQNERQEDREDLRQIQEGVALAHALISLTDARAIAIDLGVTGYKPLPPGIRKNLARGKPLPPGIQKSRMPEGFLGKLPKQAGYEWRSAGADLLLVQAGTEIVADVLSDVFK